MRIKRISLQNFNSFKNTTIDFASHINDVPTLYLINGLNCDSDSEDASNGSGKSTLVGESIFYSLYGRCLRGSKQKVKLNDMIKHGCSKMTCSVEYFIDSIENDDSILRITRHKTRDGSSETDVNIDGEQKNKRTKRLSDKDIKLFIDILPEVFSQVATYYRDNQNLLSMNYAQRLDFFKNMVDLSIIDDYYNKIKNFKLTNDKYLDRLILLKRNTQEIIDIINENKDKYKEYIVKQLDEAKTNLIITENKGFIDDNEIKEQLQKTKTEYNNITADINDIKSKINYETSVINKIKKEISNIKKLSGINCPTCKQPVDVKYVLDSINEYQTLIGVSESNIVKLNIDMDNYNKKALEMKDVYDNLTTQLNKINNENLIRNQTINNIRISINKLKKELDNIKINPDEVADKDKYERRLVSIHRALALREQWKEACEYWYNMFAPKSLLRSAIIRKYITIISDIFEYYISKLYNNEILSKIMIDDDGQIDVLLYSGDNEINYWQLSSGEKKRIDVAMLLAMYEFMSFINPHMPKFILLDEIFDSLDTPGIASIMETLLDVQERHKIDIFIISHISIPKENIPDTTRIKNILVIKKDKCSEAKYIDSNIVE